jgi:DNA-binding NarL/FixJ family response regulator
LQTIPHACASPTPWRSSAAAPPWSSRSHRLREARALPERPRVAFEGDALGRERLSNALADTAEIVERDVADLVVYDARDAADALAAIDDGFTQPTVLLVDEPHAQLARAALVAGAAAVLPRQSDGRELRAAIAAVVAGLVVVDESAREALAPHVVALTATSMEPLTERERQVLDMLAAGLSNRRIAQRLQIAENTVKAHVAAVLAKLGASTRTEAVTTALRLGLLML